MVVASLVKLLGKDMGNKQLGADFVPNVARGLWDDPLLDPNIITYAIDKTRDPAPFSGGLTAAETTAAIASPVLHINKYLF